MSEDKKIPFTISDIEELATPSSFDKGIDYFESGAVGKIIRKGNHFEGEVFGSRKYKVSLNLDNGELFFNCNCPYDFGGICKHSVAFGLKILNGLYEEQEEIAAKKISKEEFEGVFEKAKTEKKLKFLQQLLDRDSDLQSQFIEFTKETSENLDELIGEKIDSIKEEIHQKLSNLDFDELYPEYDRYDDGYWREEWEIVYDIAEGMIQDVFDPYVLKITDYISKGNLLDGIRITLGIYEGSQNLPELDNYDYYIFDGEYNENVRDCLDENINKISKEISGVIKSDKMIMRIIDLIFERIRIHKISDDILEEEEEEDKEDNNNEESVFYNIKDFENLFNALVVNEVTAKYLLEYLKKNNLLENFGAAYIILNIAEIINDETLWINTAEIFTKDDKKITKLLLEKYKSNGMVADFNRISKLAFNNWPNDFDLFLIESLDKNKQRELYLEALKNYVIKKHNIKYYKILRDYLSQDEKTKFVNSFSDSYYQSFYVQMLEVEKRYKEILECAEKNVGDYDFHEIIYPILNIYSDECFNLIQKKNNDLINSEGRGRSVYQLMMKSLKLMKRIPSKQNETKKYFEKLYNHKPTLPALRDEMRKAGLI